MSQSPKPRGLGRGLSALLGDEEIVATVAPSPLEAPSSQTPSRPPLTLPIGQHMAANARYQFLIAFTMREQAKRSALQAIQVATADGALPVGADHGLPLLRYALSDTAKAHQAIENGATGKILIDIA